jgi:hypothetical protein
VISVELRFGWFDLNQRSANDFKLSAEHFDFVQVAAVILAEIIQAVYEIFRAGVLAAAGRDAENLPQLFLLPLVPAVLSERLAIAADEPDWIEQAFEKIQSLV